MSRASIHLPGRQRGAAIFVAIFLITVVVLTAGIVTLTSVTQHTGQARAGQADQAWYAALACVEEAAQEVVNNQPCTCNPVVNGFNVALTCPNPVTITEGGTEYGVFTISATAARGDPNTVIFVRRSATAQIWRESP